MPKVELHVHIEGSIRPETLLVLAKRNNQPLPADDLDGLRQWYSFRDFEHFVEVYVAISKCVRTAEDIELMFREFLVGQKEQNVLHSEATFTACTLEKHCGIPWDEQRDAIRSARAWGESELGVSLGVVLDIVRGDPAERAFQVLDWVCDGKDSGVVALGLAGIERLGTRAYADVFDEARRRGVPAICHAGETSGPESIWEVLDIAHARRVGHGVRCMEDGALVERLVQEQVPLEVCPSSNVCLGVFPSLADHPIRRMLDAGLNVTINSDDPPMFSTTLTDEWIRVVEMFGLTYAEVNKLTQSAIEASLVTDARRAELRSATALLASTG